MGIGTFRGVCSSTGLVFCYPLVLNHSVISSAFAMPFDSGFGLASIAAIFNFAALVVQVRMRNGLSCFVLICFVASPSIRGGRRWYILDEAYLGNPNGIECCEVLYSGIHTIRSGVVSVYSCGRLFP